MAAEFRHYIDDVLLTDEPANWDKFVINIVRDTDAQALIVKYPITLDFFGQGWDILKAIFDQEMGYCEDVNYRVEKKCESGFRNLFQGKIFISQIDFNLTRCRANAQIIDDSFFARIFKNIAIEATLDVNQSKNEVTITPAAEFDLTVYAQATGINDGTTRKAIDIKEAFTYLTAFMSDGEVGFRSDFYDNLPDDEQSCILTGERLRRGTTLGPVPTISFEDLFDGQRKLYNLLMTIETDPDGSVFLRIEDDEFFFDNADVLELTKINDLVENTRQELLFSKVVFGSPGSGTTGAFPQITFFSWNEEEFVIAGQCNTDNELNLEIETVTNGNVVESIRVGSTAFDSDLVTIQYNKLTTTASKTNPLGNSPADTIYNGTYLNSSVSERYDLQGNIQKSIGDGNDGFMASNTVTDAFNVPVASGFVAATTPFPFDDDFTPPNNDPNGNYSIVTFEYVSPLSGLYTFNTTALYRWATLNAQQGTVRISVERFTAGDVLITSNIVRTDNQFTANPAPNTPYSTSGVPINFNLLAGEKVKIKYEADVGGSGAVDGDIEFIPGCTFDALATANGGGLMEEKNGDEYRVIGVEFDRALSDDQIADLTNTPYLAVLGDHDGVTKKKTYANNININAFTGETDWQMIRNVNET